jgi:hypothetical protein
MERYQGVQYAMYDRVSLLFLEILRLWTEVHTGTRNGEVASDSPFHLRIHWTDFYYIGDSQDVWQIYLGLSRFIYLWFIYLPC